MCCGWLGSSHTLDRLDVFLFEKKKHERWDFSSTSTLSLHKKKKSVSHETERILENEAEEAEEERRDKTNDAMMTEPANPKEHTVESVMFAVAVRKMMNTKRKQRSEENEESAEACELRKGF